MEETLDEMWQKISQMSDAEVDEALAQASANVESEDFAIQMERMCMLVERKLEKKDGIG